MCGRYKLFRLRPETDTVAMEYMCKICGPVDIVIERAHLPDEAVIRWLHRGRHARRRVEALERTRREAWGMATGTVASGNTGRGSDVSRRAERYAAAALAADQELKRLDQINREITDVIACVRDNTLAALLQDRFVNGLTWEETARNIGHDYSYTIQALFPRAIAAVKDPIESHCPPVL